MPVSIADLKLQKRWTLWQLKPKDGKPGEFTKPPCNAEGFKHDITNPANLKTYAELEPLASKFSGLGFALGNFDGVSVWGVDIDKCCDAQLGKFSPEIRELIIALNSYAEYSPSGEGCHVVGLGELPGNKMLVRQYPGAKQIEVKGLGYYFTFTDRHLSKTPANIMDRQTEILALYDRVQKIPKAAKEHEGLVVTMPVSEEERFQKLMAGDMSAYNDDHSTADFALCILLAKKYGCNAFKVDAEFRKSLLYRDKWERDDYRENTITRAVAAVLKDAPVIFDDPEDEPMDDDSPREFLVETLVKDRDGWFPKGEVSLIGGSSGTGKTSWSIPLLEKVRKGETVYGHPTTPREYRVILHDRSRKGTLATLKMLGLPKEAIERCIRLTTTQQQRLPAEILSELMERHPGVECWFIEGLDMWLPDLYDMRKVATLIDSLQRLALLYNAAIVATVGSPKMKSKEGKYSGRDSLFGSVALGRKAETVVLFQFHDAEDSNSVIVCEVKVRCGAPEKFYLAWGEYGLQLTTKPESLSPTPGPKAKPAEAHPLKKRIFKQFSPGERIEFSDDLEVSRGTYYTWLEKAVSAGIVDERRGHFFIPAAHGVVTSTD